MTERNYFGKVLSNSRELLLIRPKNLISLGFKKGWFSMVTFLSRSKISSLGESVII